MPKRFVASNDRKKDSAKRVPPAPKQRTAAPAGGPGARKAEAAKSAHAKPAHAKPAHAKPAHAKRVPAKPGPAKPTPKASLRKAAPARGGSRQKPAAARLLAPRKAALQAIPEPETGARSKFDLGSRVAEPAVQHIPWGYGQDRITALPIDPRRMYAYWEIRDDAVAVARAALGRGGKDAWLNLRVYDISGRIFDGTNAHSYFDVKVDRDTRQWFLEVGKPTSTHCVEVGLKSYEGYFQKIARSGRVEFPRAEPAAPGPVEWMSVHDVTGEIGPTVPGVPHLAPAQHAPAGGHHAPPPLGAWAEGDYWLVDGSALLEQALQSGFESHDPRLTEWIAGHGRLEWIGAHGHTEWRAGGLRFEWVGPVVSTTWEAGPFPMPVEAPGLVEERHEGTVLVQRLGDRTRVIYGPWQVVIHGVHGHAERRVIARWEVRKSWLTDLGFEVVGGSVRWLEGAGARPGSSEKLLVGASERRFMVGSELRLAGASEIFRIGASEFRFQGGSETLFAGGSEARGRGASEVRLRGASEQRLGGASEKARKGASERRLGGASERKAPEKHAAGKRSAKGK